MFTSDLLQSLKSKLAASSDCVRACASAERERESGERKGGRVVRRKGRRDVEEGLTKSRLPTRLGGGFRPRHGSRLGRDGILVGLVSPRGGVQPPLRHGCRDLNARGVACQEEDQERGYLGGRRPHLSLWGERAKILKAVTS